MKLSYIVPVYKVENYLHQCIESILSQTMDDYEIILVDDGSPDSCPMMCDEYKDKYPDKFTVIHKQNEGLAVARNVGLDSAKGEYVFFIDSDDFLISDRMNSLYDIMKKADADILHMAYISLLESSGKEVKTNVIFDTEKIYSHADMEEMINSPEKGRFLTYVWRNIYKTDFLKENGIKSDPKLRMIQDAPFNIEAFLKAKRFVAVDTPIYCYRHREGSIQRRKYIPDCDKYFEYQWEAKMKHYEENCTPSIKFYAAVAEQNIISFLPRMLRNIYANKIKERYVILKRIGNSDMMRRSFKDYDIKKFKSKSLDWWATWCIKHKLYLPAHLICDKILYK